MFSTALWPVRSLRLGVAVVLLTIWGCTTEQVATSIPQPAVHDDMLEALREGVESELEQPVVIEVDELRKNERWAFVTAVSLTADREPIDYSQTKFAKDVEDGAFDDWLCALLANEGDGWKLVVLEIGATDAPFVDWPERYGVPEDIVLP